VSACRSDETAHTHLHADITDAFEDFPFVSARYHLSSCCVLGMAALTWYAEVPSQGFEQCPRRAATYTCTPCVIWALQILQVSYSETRLAEYHSSKTGMIMSSTKAAGVLTWVKKEFLPFCRVNHHWPQVMRHCYLIVQVLR
jgi:hypothetical protein